MKLVRKLLKSTLFLLYLVLASSFLLFSLTEAFPGLLDVVNLNGIKYYAQKKWDVDDRLVFRPRTANFTIDTVFNGDLYDIDPVLADHVPPPEMRYTASYKDGFRVNSSSPPYDMLILGDSFVDIGESDSSTFSELVAKHSGFATFNLGRGGYGPYQYKVLLSQYLKLRPRYAVVCFFAGNDVEDVKHYDEFLAGGDYGIYVRGKNFLERYAIAVSDTFSFLRTTLERRVIPATGRLGSGAKSWLAGGKDLDTKPKKIRDYIGAIRLKDQAVPMRFSYWNTKQSAEELIKEREWQSLKRVLGEIKTITDRHDIELIIVYIPTKVQVYGRHFVEKESGSGFLGRIHDQLKYERNTLDAFIAVTKELNLEFIDLDGYFKKLAAEGELLFYPFDTHWNARGRELAAEYLVANIGAITTPNSTRAGVTPRGSRSSVGDHFPPARPTPAPSTVR